MANFSAAYPVMFYKQITSSKKGFLPLQNVSVKKVYDSALEGTQFGKRLLGLWISCSLREKHRHQHVQMCIHPASLLHQHCYSYTCTIKHSTATCYTCTITHSTATCYTCTIKHSTTCYTCTIKHSTATCYTCTITHSTATWYTCNIKHSTAIHTPV